MAFSTSDTIVAVATPPGRGGLGVVRISGPRATAVAQRLTTRTAPLQPRHATLTTIRGASSRQLIDQIVATFFPGPASYTGEDVIELSAHGSPVILRAILDEAMQAGARLAEPGEFTLRAFLHGRLDLLQVEAVADLIDAATPQQARAAFDQLEGTATRAVAAIDAALFDLIARLEASVDFPDEGYHFIEPDAVAQRLDDLIESTRGLLAGARRGRMIREGFQVVIAGRPNVGKSSLFNALVGASRTIVTDVPGTTRDLVTERVEIGGLQITLVDTAGIHDTSDQVEREGVDRARSALSVADLTLLVFDRSGALDADDRRLLEITAGARRLIVLNKMDVAARARPPDLGDATFSVSTLTGEGMDVLRRAIAGALDVEPLRDRPAVANLRHTALLQRAQDALERARAAALNDGASLSEEFVLADLQDARDALEDVSGRRAPEDLLNEIFSRFCVGK